MDLEGQWAGGGAHTVWKASLSAHLQEAGVRHHLLGIHHVHQRLFDGHVANAAHVKPVDVFPPWQQTHTHFKAVQSFLLSSDLPP